jgi:hypothetical protein
MDLQALINEAQALEAVTEKLQDQPTEMLQERHEALKAERLAMPDSEKPEIKAGVTNKVKRIETILRERGVDFEPLPQANQPVALGDLDDDELIAEYGRLKELKEEAKRDNASSGVKGSITIRMNNIITEAKVRQAKRNEELEQPASEEEGTEVPETEEPTDAELAEVQATEEVQVEETSEQQGRSRRRR